MPKILLIEDEPGIADAARFAFTREGWTCEWAALAEAGLAALKRESFDLIVLDVGLPDRSGFEVLRQLRTFSPTPVMFLTARAEEVDRVVGLELGADDYLVKPFSPRELVARVRAILRRAGVATAAPPSSRRSDAPSPAHPADSSRFQIIEDRRQVWFHGTALDLSPYEYHLLSYLIRHPGRVFTREQLMQGAWSDDGARLDRAVDAHIKNIRARLRKIEPKADPIKTHRGFGYSFEAGP
jgi:two-component system catabolic regulation response regulator CreB